MKSIFIILYLFAATISSAQNLIPNSGFDINNGCPNQIGQIDKADGWSVWGGTPDYFHSCSNATFPIYGVPVNSRGFQVPLSGDAYIGLFTFSSLNANFREYVGRALSTSLVVGQTYFVSFYINHADVNVLSHATDKIGIKFSTVPYSLVNPDTANNNPHVFLSTVVSDTANWVQVSGSFVADSAYTHLGIGNYFTDSATTIVTGTSTANYAYYLIEDICVSSDQKQCNIQTGISNYNDESKMLVFPNPSNGIINVHAAQNTDAMIILYDITGNKIVEEKIILLTNQPKQFDFTGLADGFYYIKIFNDEFSHSEKLIIRK